MNGRNSIYQYFLEGQHFLSPPAYYAFTVFWDCAALTNAMIPTLQILIPILF